MTPIEIAQYWTRYQAVLFPSFEEEVGTLTDRHRELVMVLDTLRLERHFFDGPSAWTGRHPVSRLAMARCFVAKAVLNLASTRGLIDRLKVDPMLRRLIGFEAVREIPSEGTFSNAFTEFSSSEAFTRVHEKLVREAFEGRLVGHISRDASAIPAREKLAEKVDQPQPTKPKRKRGRPRKGEIRVKEPVTRIERQATQTLGEMLAELPCQCDCGSKKGAKGYVEHWFGYKLHLDVEDNGIPIACLLTSASLNDSQVAIPLEAISAKRVVSLYSLMDKGYDARGIRLYVERTGKVPLIEARKRKGEDSALPFDPASARRFRLRTSVERAFSQIKDNLGGRHVRVRGGAKVLGHLMVSVLALTALGLLRLSLA
jgi:hypothetical protein